MTANDAVYEKDDVQSPDRLKTVLMGGHNQSSICNLSKFDKI